MKRMFKFLSSLILIILIISGCSKVSKEDIFKYKDSYVGDNSAIGNIVNQLQGAEHLKMFELETTEKPYGITLDYDWSESKENYEKTAIVNATFLFTLVNNADWIIFNFDNQEYKITREELKNWYGEDFSKLKNEAELNRFVQKHLKNEEKMNQLFNP